MDGEDMSDFSDEEDWTDTAWSTEETSNVLAERSKTIKPSNIQGFPSHTKGNEVATKLEKKMEDDNLMSRMRLNDNKAGMEGLDKEKINQIILEASKGSKFFENERKKEEQVRKRIQEQQKKYDKITEAQLSQGLIQADMLLEEFERARDLSRTIVHIDMDAFYAAVEMRDKPSLKDKPMAVGGNDMLSTSNYHARKYGVRAAMPGFIGKKLCPDLIIVPSNFEKYTSVSKQVKEILADYDPNFCPMSLDEAYLDITDHLQKRQMMMEKERTYLCRKCDNLDPNFCVCDLNELLKESVLNCENNSSDSPQKEDEKGLNELKYDNETDGRSIKCLENSKICPVCGKPFPDYDIVVFGSSPDDTVQEMRSRIEQKTRLTASAGIAPNMMLSKVCSDRNKPNGQYRIQPTVECVMDFIKDLPIRKISGIGKVSEQMLNAVGVVTCTDLYNKRALLYHLYSQISFNYFMRICLGIGSTTVERDSERKSISTERTFNEINKPAELYSKCNELCDALSVDLEEEQLKGKTVTIKLKTVKFEVKTRAHTLPEYTSDPEVIFSAAKDLLKTEVQNVAPNPLRLRLMGVRMSSLLHQSLCKSKHKQRTLSGLVKKMGNKSAVNKNVTASETIQCAEADKITQSYSTENEFLTGSDEVEQNQTTLSVLKDEVSPASLNKYKSSSCLEKISFMPSSSMTSKDLKNMNMNCDKQEKEVTDSQNPLLLRAEDHGISGKISNMKEFGNFNTLKSDSCGQNVNKCDDNKCSFNTASGVKSVTCSSRQILSEAEDSARGVDYVDILGKCEGEILESVRKPKENKETDKNESIMDLGNTIKIEHDIQELDNSSVVRSKSMKSIDKQTPMENKNAAKGTLKNNLSDFSVEKNENELQMDEDEKEKGEIEARQGNSRDDAIQIENRTGTLETGKENVYECPICRNDIRCDTLSDFNQHIDICLNKKVVMDCSRSENLKANLKQTVKSSQHKNSPFVSKKVKVMPNVTKSPKSLMSKSNDTGLTPKSEVDTRLGEQSDSQNTNLDTDVNVDKHRVKVCVEINSNLTDSSLNCDQNNAEACSSTSGESNTDQTLNITKLVCPVCFMEQSRASLDDFNSHVDSCLSKGTISDILKEQKTVVETELCKRSPLAHEKLKSGKRKWTNSGQVSRNGQNKIRSIDLFFKT